MPELPDVANLKKYMESTALHRKVAHTSVDDERILCDTTPQALGRRVKGASFTGARRHGKFLFGAVDSGGFVVFHFGMTGNFSYYGEREERPEYAKVVFSFAGNGHLAYVCTRLLGEVGYTEDKTEFVEERGLGPDALDGDVDAEWFTGRLKGRSAGIKSLLMNQSVIAGIGNVYADEILFQSRIHPAARADRLNATKKKRIFHAVRRVMRVAVRHNADVSSFPRGYLMKNRGEGEKCGRCSGTIEKTKVSGRGTYFCPKCQEKP